jgi:hypothetical protein
MVNEKDTSFNQLLVVLVSDDEIPHRADITAMSNKGSEQR